MGIAGFTSKGYLFIATSSEFSATTTLTVCANTNCVLPSGSGLASTTNAVAVFASVTSNGAGMSIAAEGQISAGLSDIGEFVPVVGSDADYSAGDLLSVATNTLVDDGSYAFQKSSLPYDSDLAGVVTVTAGLVAGGGGPHGSTIISLAGRVPIKVTGENGPIAAGDYLTSSDVPGYGMKATETGRVIGIAMEPFSGTSTAATGSIMTFLSPHYDNGLMAGLMGNGVVVNLGGATTSATGTAATSTLVIGGGLQVNGDVVFFGRPYLNSDSGGFAVVGAGQDHVNISFTDPYVAQPVVSVTLTLDITNNSGNTTAQAVFANGVTYLVTNKSDNGFTILLNKPAPADVTFSWIALAVNGAKTFTLVSSVSSASPSPSPSPPGGSVLTGTGAGADVTTITTTDTTTTVPTSTDTGTDTSADASAGATATATTTPTSSATRTASGTTNVTPTTTVPAAAPDGATDTTNTTDAPAATSSGTQSS